MKKKIALEGAINGCTDSQANDWRQDAIKRLSHKYDFHNPMDLDCRGREAEMQAELVRYDLAGMAHSHISLVNWPKASIGTDIGMGFCWMLHKEVIVVYSGEVISPWLALVASRIFKTMEEALDYLDNLP